MKRTILGILLLASCVCAQAPSTDWGDCQDDLDRARRASSDASDAAEKVKTTLDEFQECRRDPETYDLVGDGCRARRSDYESALSDFKSEMDTLDSRLRSIQDACSYEFTINRMAGVQASESHLQGAEARLCSSYRRLASLGMPPAQVVQMCKKDRGADKEDWCKACAGIK